MDSSQLVLAESALAFAELLDSLDGVSERESWAEPAQTREGWLYTGGSILEMVLHVASCKRMYASAAFGNLFLRWRDVHADWEAIGSSLSSAVEYLQMSQEEWLSHVRGLGEADWEIERPLNWGGAWPTWRILANITQHDTYHAGQVNLVRSFGLASDTPPATMAQRLKDDLINCPSW